MATWMRGPHVARPSGRIGDLRARPDVAISIDTEDQPPLVLLIRGKAVVTEADGIVEEYAASASRYLGPEVARAYLAQHDGAAVTMPRISVRPEWVGLIDFRDRMPGPLGGVAR